MRSPLLSCSGLRIWGLSFSLRGIQNEDEDKLEIVSLKGMARHQIVAPPTQHMNPHRGVYEWVPGFDVSRIAGIDADELTKAVRFLGAAAFVSRSLYQDGRHDYSLALSGFLLGSGVEQQEVLEILAPRGSISPKMGGHT